MISEEIARPLVKYLRLPEERTVDLISWPAGAGKTRAVLQDVIREVGEGVAVLWLTQTVEILQTATYGRLTGTDASDGFTAYLSPDQVEQHNVRAAEARGRAVGESLSESLNAYFSQPQREGRVFLASWQGYLQAFRTLTPGVKQSLGLRIVVDEIPEIRRQETCYIADASTAVRWQTYLDMADANNLRMSQAPEFQGHWRKALSKHAGGTRDAVTSSMPKLAECLAAPELWLSTMLQQGKARTYFVMYLRPEVLNIGRSVEILAANAEDSLLFKIYRQCGINFRINSKYTELARLSVDNGECFTIVPLQERRLSKNQYAQDKELAQKLLAKAAQSVRAHFARDERFIFCLPAGVRMPRCPPSAASTKTVLSGSNAYKDMHAAAFLAAMNLEDVYALELRERWGFTRTELEAAFGVECCYQYAMRLKGRHGRKVAGEKYLVLVGGLEMAEGLQRKIPGSVIDPSHLQPAPGNHEAGKRGAGLLGSLPALLTKAQKNKLTGYCRALREAPERAPTRSERKGLAQVAAALGRPEERFQADFLRVARGEASGQAVFTAAEYRHGLKSGRNLEAQ